MKKILLIIIIALISITACGCTQKKDLTTKDFIKIIANGSAQEVKDAVKRVDDINAVVDMNINIKGQTHRIPLTPAMTAAMYVKDPEIISILAKNGADMNPRFYDKEYGEMKNSLFEIAQFPTNSNFINPKIGLALLENGAKDNGKFPYSYTDVLDNAIEISSSETVEYVLDNKTVLNAAKSRGCDAALFYTAASKNSKDAKGKVQILLNKGFDVNMRCKNGMNSIEWIDKILKQNNADPEAYALIKKHTK